MRNSTDITIWRFGSDDWASIPDDIVTVPITIGSRRKFHLMTEDSITLNFSLSAPVEFKVGDYISDEIFGMFFLREKQLPTYNKATGGYDYQLRFDKAYWLWENHILMLTAGLSGADPITPVESSGTITLTSPQLSQGQSTFPYKREESIWCLTNSLAYHVQQVLYNLLAAGLLYHNRAYNARILPTATKAKEIRYINYDAKHICTALTEIANEFDCEWWVTYETANNVTTGWINFGKCELDNTAKEFVLGDNVETMQASRDLTNYANRIYVFGGTKNVPTSYRKTLLLDIDHSDSSGDSTVYWDSTREIDPYTMLVDKGTVVDVKSFQFPPFNQPTQDGGYYITDNPIGGYTLRDNEITHNTSDSLGQESTIHYRSVAMLDGVLSRSTGAGVFGFKKATRLSYSAFSGGFRFKLPAQTDTTEVILEMRLFLENVDDTTEKIYLSANPVRATNYFSNPNSDPHTFKIETQICGQGTITIDAGKKYKLVLEGYVYFSHVVIAYSWTDPLYNDDGKGCLGTSGELTPPAGKSFAASVKYNNTEYGVTFNPFGLIEGEEGAGRFCFDGTSPDFSSLPKTVELVGYIASAIPLDHYTDNTDDPSSLIGLGERRLRLPANTNGYVETPNVLEVQRVEMAVKNDNIYPRCYLRVTSVATEERIDKMEYADGSEYEWPWTAFVLEAEQLDGSEFPFRKTYVKDGEKLRALFLSDTDEQTAYDEMGLDWEEDNNHGGGTILTDITPAYSTWRDNSYYNTSGSIASYSGSKAVSINVSAYQGMTIIINVYVGPSNSSHRCMFKNSGGSIISGTSERIRSEVTRTVPSNANTLCLSNMTSDCPQPYVKVVQEAPIEGFLIAGMEFDVGFNSYLGNKYTLIRNEDYGAKLPSSILKPSVGDVFVLTGWNVEAISGLGLVSKAETQLKDFADKYLAAIEEDGWTFRCGMMTDIDEPLYLEGTKVNVYHNALVGGFKESRVIGYDMKLDIPEDSPVYEIGETDAYSRIKQLEKQVEKL